MTSLLLIPAFLVTRYGNEKFEQVRSSEVAAVRALYRMAPQGSVLVSPTSQLPWRFAYATEYDYSRPTDPPAFMDGRWEAVRHPVPIHEDDRTKVFLIVTTSQVTYASEALGEPPDWFSRVRPLLHERNGYRLVFHNRDARIYEYEAKR